MDWGQKREGCERQGRTRCALASKLYLRGVSPAGAFLPEEGFTARMVLLSGCRGGATLVWSSVPFEGQDYRLGPEKREGCEKQVKAQGSQ
jgi:hypothetical protein